MTDDRTARFFLDMPREVLLAWASSQIAHAAAHLLCWNCRAEMLTEDGICPVCGKDQDPFAAPEVDPAPPSLCTTHGCNSPATDRVESSGALVCANCAWWALT